MLFGSGGVFALVAATSAYEGALAAITIAKPTGTADGDLMVAVMSSRTASNQTWTGDTGWTEVYDQATPANIRVAWKIASGEGANYVFTMNGTNPKVATIATYSRAAFDVVGVAGLATNPLVAPSITVTNNASILLAYFSNGITTIPGIPSGMTSVISAAYADMSVRLASQAVNSGATGTRTATNTDTSRSGSILLSIKPA